MGWLLIGASALGSALFVAAAMRARHGFLARIIGLLRRIEQAPKALSQRSDLPPEVFALARRLGASANPCGRLVRLTQSGEMQLKPGAKSFAFKAEQTISVAEVSFIWRARFKIAGLPMQIVDYLVGGEGGLQGRIFDIFPVVAATDTDAMFRGEAMRYLSELIWNPDAILFNPELDWRAIDSRTLGISTGRGVRRCEVRLTLNEAGDPVGMEADDRPRQDGGSLTVCPWFVRGGGYRVNHGRRLPTEGVAGWRLDGIEFIYWRGHIESWSIEA